MKVQQRRRGRPLIALFVILGAWTGSRALFWEAAVPLPSAQAEPAFSVLSDGGVAHPRRFDASAGDAARFFEKPAVPSWRPVGSPAVPAQQGAGTGNEAAPFAFGPASFLPSPYPAGTRPLQGGSPASLTRRTSDAAPFHPPARDAGGRRWSADSWLLLRDDGGVALASGMAPATYGASQAGAVLRYRLAPLNGHRPTTYLRATAALNGSNESEGAAGLSARPFPTIPVIVAAELRLTSQPNGTHMRPAAMAITELAPFALPFDARGEAYVQAGYVGGRYATPFVDGQLRVDRPVATIGRAELRAGGGAWGGAQEGASRLDLGPAATMALGLGGRASARVAVDWRFRVAGNAEPDSGPALTLSAGF